jgi:hypothetical protein
VVLEPGKDDGYNRAGMVGVLMDGVLVFKIYSRAIPPNFWGTIIIYILALNAPMGVLFLSG